MTKTTITDTPTNTIFGYLYVREFIWSSANDNETHVGHPKAGRVYRSAFNKDTKTWRLYYEIDGKITGMFLPKLIVEDKTEEDKFFTELQYTGRIVELTKETILHCDVTEEDLDLLIKWMEEDNKPLKQIMGFEQPQFLPVSGDELIKIFRQPLKDDELIAFVREAMDLKESNKILFDAIGDVIWFLNDQASKPDQTIDGSWTEFSKTLGAGKNIGKALDHISRYGGESPRTNLMREDLMGAIRSLVLEQGRRQLHGIE